VLYYIRSVDLQETALGAILTSSLLYIYVGYSCSKSFIADSACVHCSNYIYRACCSHYIAF